MRSMLRSLDNLLYLIVASGVVQDPVLVEKSLCLALFFHDRMKPDESEVRLWKVLCVADLGLLPTERAANHRAVPQLKHALLTECMPA